LKLKFIKILIVAIGGLLLLNAVITPFLVYYNTGLISLTAYAVALIIYGLLIDKARKLRIACAFISGISIAFVLSSSFLAIYGSINTFKGDENVIIVLGSGIKGEKVPVNLANRLDEAVKYYNRNSGVVIVVSSGKGNQEDITEAESMKRYLILKGIRSSKSHRGKQINFNI